MIDPADLELFCFAESAEEAWSEILRWYAARGRSIFEATAEAESGDEI